MVVRGRDLALLGFCSLACSGQPTRSYCEALCDWAVACAATTRGIDAEALTAECLAATHAEGPNCARAEAGELDPASVALLKPCVSAIDDNADELKCEGFVGTFDQIKASAPPADCATQGADYLSTYTQAQISTAESGAELCERFSDAVCQQTEQCILGDATTMPGAYTALGGNPYDLCMQRIDATFTQTCVSAGLWEEDESFLDVNLAREAARQCVPTISRMECTDLLAVPPVLDPSCGGAFTSAEDLAAIGEMITGLAEEFEPYVR